MSNSPPPASSDDETTRAPTDTSQHQTLPRMQPYSQIPTPLKEAKDSAERHYLSLKRTDPDLIAEFETAFAAWKGVWHSTHWDSWARDTDEYLSLLAMGPEIIPLLVYELTKEENFGACCLYNDLEKDKHFKVDPDDVVNYLTLNRQAYLIVELNLERNRDVGVDLGPGEIATAG